MKRINNLYEKIYSLDNLRLADAIARKGKAKQHGVQQHIPHAEKMGMDIHLNQQQLN